MNDSKGSGRIKEILLAITDLEGGERVRYLDEACAGDPELRKKVESILLHEGDQPETLPTRGLEDLGHGERPGDDLAPTEYIPSASTDRDRIGPYRILEKLGEGGFGEVYAAEQTEPVKRRVALKILKAGMDTKAVLARFEAERQALAMMDHPNIAKVLDAGETPTGRSYFAMELIHGEPITDYCDRHRLTTKQRLDLFLPVCAAIQHAHLKGIIHRDIKPANVLISTVDGSPAPKVIDFGIAKATAASLTDKTVYTMQGQMVGTPTYMSPEQAEMTGFGVDTRTDVYSLGVLLYELITGTPPFDSKTLMEAGIQEMHRVIREKEPPKPSTRISSLGGGATQAAQKRRTEPARLAKLVRGELDWITLKALEKDPGRRYETVSGLAADVRRYLAGDAVLAHPPSRAYQLGKLLKRHKLPAAFATTVALLLVGLAVTMAVLRGQAEDARAEAQARAGELELVTDFQASMLSDIDADAMGTALVEDFVERVGESMEANGVPPEVAEPARATFEENIRSVNATNVALTLIDEQVLARAVKAIEEEFAEQPETRSALQQTVADTYKDIGLYSRAESLQEAALETRRRVLGEDHPETLSSLNNLGTLLMAMGKLEDPRSFFEKVLEGQRRARGEDHPETLAALANLGTMLYAMGELEEALPVCEKALEEYRRVRGEDHPDTHQMLLNMGALLFDMGKYEEAGSSYEEALEASRRVHGEDHPNTLSALTAMGTLLNKRRKYEEAHIFYEEALAGNRRARGEDHPETLRMLAYVSVNLMSMGKFEEALPFCEKALEGNRRVLGEDHPMTLYSIGKMGSLLRSTGKLKEALPFCEQALEGARRQLGDDHPQTDISLNDMGALLRQMGKFDEARPFFEKVLERRRRVFGVDHSNTLRSLINLGVVVFKQGEHENVISLLEPAETSCREVFSGDNVDKLGLFLSTLGRSRAATGAFAEAEANLLAAWDIQSSAQKVSASARESTLTGLTELYEAWHVAQPDSGHHAKAAEWRAKLVEVQEQESE